MKVLSFSKQPIEVVDHDIEYAEWLGQDSFLTVSVESSSGVIASVGWVTETRLKVWISGGTVNESYTVQLTLKTLGGRVRQDEITVKIKEIM